LLVCSRDQSRADATAKDFNGRGVAFDAIEQHIVASDIVISSTGAPHPVITKKSFARLMKQRRYRPIFLIDIAVPRDVEPTVAELENVYLYNLDDLQDVVTQTTTQRSQQAESAAHVVRQHVEAYVQWHRQRAIGPMIDALYKRYNAIAQAELERTLGKLPVDDAGRRHLEELVHRIVQKMLHDPVSQLRQSHDPRDDGAGPTYAHAIEQLFKLVPGNPQEQTRDGEDA
jgi:glutamyl-tRNA reductase